jgi:hypothetical protein
MGRPELYPLKKVIGFDERMLEAVEKWRAKQNPIPTVSEAIRRLVELGLAHQPLPAGKPHKGAAKAKDMAKAVLNNRLKDLPEEEQVSRKRRLLKGPER